jgi:hypothetical protein
VFPNAPFMSGKVCVAAPPMEYHVGGIPREVQDNVGKEVVPILFQRKIDRKGTTPFLSPQIMMNGGNN